MLEWIMGLDQKAIQGWLEVLVLLVGLVKLWRKSDENSRWAKIRAVIPDAHRLAQRIAENTNTKKDDEFVRQAGKLLRAFGIKLSEEESEAVRAMGSAEHQTFKLLRESATGIPGQVLEVAQQLDPPVQGSQVLEREP